MVFNFWSEKLTLIALAKEEVTYIGQEDEKAAVQRGDEGQGASSNPDAVNEAYSNRPANGGSLKEMSP